MDHPQQYPPEDKTWGCGQPASRCECAARYSEDHVLIAAALRVVCRMVQSRKEILLCKPGDLLDPFSFFCLSLFSPFAVVERDPSRRLYRISTGGGFAGADLYLSRSGPGEDVRAVGRDVGIKSGWDLAVVRPYVNRGQHVPASIGIGTDLNNPAGAGLCGRRAGTIMRMN